MNHSTGDVYPSADLPSPEDLITIEVLQGRVINIQRTTAIEAALNVCINYAADRRNVDPEKINITKPSRNKYETDGFHMFLVLMNDLSIDIVDTGAALGYSSSKAHSLDIHTAIAQDRVNDKTLKTGLSSSYDVIRGRFRREVRDLEHNQQIEADSKLIFSSQSGDDEAFTQIFERNADTIINDLIRHGHDAPPEIIDLAEEAVRHLVNSYEPDELAQAGLNSAVVNTVRALIFDKMPDYRRQIEREQKKQNTKRLVTALNPGVYLSHLIEFEKKEAQRTEDFLDLPRAELDREQTAKIVKAGLDHFRARAEGEINPRIEILERITNPDKRLKRYRILRDSFRAAFRRHIIFSAYMKQNEPEEIDIADIYEHTDEGHSRRWSKLLNQIIDTSHEE